jgi:hypothetical protein
MTNLQGKEFDFINYWMEQMHGAFPSSSSRDSDSLFGTQKRKEVCQVT